MLCIHYFLIKRKKLFGRPNRLLRNTSSSLRQFESETFLSYQQNYNYNYDNIIRKI